MVAIIEVFVNTFRDSSWKEVIKKKVQIVKKEKDYTQLSGITEFKFILI